MLNNNKEIWKQKEKNIGKVAWKKVNRTYADQQMRAWESKREKLIKELEEYYDIDQFEAAAKYDELLERANINDFRKDSNRWKYQVADEPITKDNSWKELSKWQQEYFKWSKVVDENGNLMRVYHWTNAKYTVYNKKELWSASWDLWFFWDWWYFATHKWEAWYYWRNVMEWYLDVKNPFYFSELDKIWDKSIRNSEFITLRNLSKLDDSIWNIKYNWYSLKEIWSMVDDYLNDVKIEKLNDSVDNYWDEVTYWKVTHDWKSEIYTSVKWFSEDEMLAARLNEYMRDKFWYIKVSDILEDMTSESRFNKDTKSFSQILQDKWYDWIIVWDSASKADEIVVFNSNQFKNLDNLDPTKNEDIRFQKYWTAWEWEKWVNAIQGLNIRNFKNWKSVKELANNYWIKTHIVDSISTPEWQKAYGMYWDKVITLARDLKESTVPHELLHATFDMVDSAKRTKILEGIQKRLKVDDIQAEEWLADNFSEYYRTGKFDTKAVPTTLAWQIKQFFQQIKEFIDWTYANRKEITQLFDDIIDGKIEWEYWVYSDPKFQSVRHGSSAEFDRFDSSHMGEWEWNQVHWWGHYVAVNKNTAKKYANLKYTPAHKSDSFVYKDTKWEFQQNIYSDKKRFVNNILDYVNDLNPYSNTNKPTKAKIKNMIKEEKWYLKEYIKEWEDAIKKIKNWEVDASEMMSIEEIQSAINRYKDEIKTWDSIDVNEFEMPSYDAEWERHLYNLDIPDPKKADTPTGKNYIEEDWKISYQQIEKIAEWLEKYDEKGNWGKYRFLEWIVRDLEDISWWWDDKLNRYVTKWNISWKKLYKHLENYFNSDKKASKFLESLWYDGIHYFWWLDWEAYVIFNDDALNIKNHQQY